jgi:hypothetical protein
VVNGVCLRIAYVIVVNRHTSMGHFSHSHHKINGHMV